MSVEALAINRQVYTKAFRLRILLRFMGFASSVKIMTLVCLLKLIIKFLIFADFTVDSSICEKQEIHYEAFTVVKFCTCLI